MRKLRLEELGRDSLDDYKSRAKRPVIIVLDNVRSGHNVGAVFRTSDAFALEQIILTGITPRPPHKEINKTAIGATLSVDWKHDADVVSALAQIKADGYTLIGVEQTTASIPLDTLDIQDNKVALVFGNEVNGLTDEVLPLLDHCVEIPQFGTKHSLNISVCAGICIYEVAKRYSL